MPKSKTVRTIVSTVKAMTKTLMICPSKVINTLILIITLSTTTQSGLSIKILAGHTLKIIKCLTNSGKITPLTVYELRLNSKKLHMDSRKL